MPRCREFIAVTILVSFLSGCANKGQSFNPLAGFGSPRIQPPATGSFGVPASQTSTSDPYYGNQPAIGATGQAAPAGAAIGTGAATTPNSGWTTPFKQGFSAVTAPFTQSPNNGAAIQTVGYDQPLTPNGQAGVASTASAQGTSTSQLLDRIRQQKMHVNDASAPIGAGVAPQAFTPVNPAPIPAGQPTAAAVPAGPAMSPGAQPTAVPAATNAGWQAKPN